MDTEKYYDNVSNSYNALYENEQRGKYLNILDTDFGGKRVLDLGCGTGMFIPYLRDKFKLVVGLDFSLQMLKKCPVSENVFYVKANALSLPFSNNCFDWVFSFSVMQDVKDWEDFVEEIRRVCSFGVVLSVLKRNKDIRELRSLFEKNFIVESVMEEVKDFIFVLKIKNKKIKE